MALSYVDVHDLRNHADVVRKTHVAIAAVAVDILAPEAGQTSERKDWAIEAIKDPASKAPEIVHYVLIANIAAQDQAAVIGASDAAYKAACATAVTKIVGAPA